MSKYNTNSIQNSTSENQENLNNSRILKIGGFKHGCKIEGLKDYNNYVLGNKGEIFQDKLLENVLDNEKRTTNTMRKFYH